MKIIFFLSLVAFSLMGCNSLNTKNKSDINKVLGKWIPIKFESTCSNMRYQKLAAPTLNKRIGIDVQSYEFLDDGTYNAYMPDANGKTYHLDYSGSYQIKDDSIFLSKNNNNNFSFKIISSTENNLIWEVEQKYNSGDKCLIQEKFEKLASSTASEKPAEEKVLDEDIITYTRYINKARQIDDGVNSFAIAFLSKVYPDYTRDKIDKNFESLLSEENTFYSYIDKIITLKGGGEKERSILYIAAPILLQTSSNTAYNLSERIYDKVNKTKKDN